MTEYRRDSSERKLVQHLNTRMWNSHSYPKCVGRHMTRDYLQVGYMRSYQRNTFRS